MRLAVAALTLFAFTTSAQALTIARDGAPVAAIVVSPEATVAEQHAAAELADYFGQMAGCAFTVGDTADGPTVYVGPSAAATAAGIDADALGDEEWIVRTVGDDLIVIGGRPRGSLYAAYHLLEDVLGVHWWNPWAETVPERPTIELADLDLHGEPVLQYRDIYRIYGYDEGRFAARNRLNRMGDPPIAARYGGGMNYGPPYHVHTFYLYFRPAEYFADHPEWYSLIEGERRAEHHQLCLTNEELRQEYLRKLREFIAQTKAEAEQTGAPAPRVYSISQNDWGGQCQCENCQAIAQREGSEAGPLLDFVNYMADGIAEDHPEIYISTLAYQYTQAPPQHIKPRDNVIIRLCDTTSNFTEPITAEMNKPFHDFLLSWAQIAKNLRIWDYAVTYADPRGLPKPTVHTYAADYQFYAENNVEGVFTELEYPLKADVRDFKVWMMCKLLEDPYADQDALVTTFTDGFYGAAGPMFREYIALRDAAVKARPSHISMSASLQAVATYMTLDVITQAQAIFDRAEAAVADDAEMLQRVRHARLSLDRATVMLWRQLTKEWVARGNTPDTIPLDRDAVAARYADTWRAEIARRLPEAQHAQSAAELESEQVRYTSLPAYIAPAEKFADLPPERVHDFTADMMRNWKNIVQVVRDEEAESGIAGRLQFPTEIDTEKQPLDRYVLPMPWGLYDVRNKTGRASATIKPEDVPGPGYHWYNMGSFEIGPSYYLYFFWSWIIQLDIDAAWDDENPDQKFDIWARIKFEGPAFPHGDEADANAISVERVVLVEAE
ncbi:MAG: DUF4838 domain-containing protein [candidate division WS1 bacterium]|jgi:hypothetical protein|nr:DUF4838 domain-containing protein [candidate division WS1 bacterium]